MKNNERISFWGHFCSFCSIFRCYNIKLSIHSLLLKTFSCPEIHLLYHNLNEQLFFSNRLDSLKFVKNEFFWMKCFASANFWQKKIIRFVLKNRLQRLSLNHLGQAWLNAHYFDAWLFFCQSLGGHHSRGSAGWYWWYWYTYPDALVKPLGSSP